MLSGLLPDCSVDTFFPGAISSVFDGIRSAELIGPVRSSVSPLASVSYSWWPCMRSVSISTGLLSLISARAAGPDRSYLFRRRPKACRHAHRMRGKIEKLTSRWSGKNAISFEEVHPEKELSIRMNFRFQIYKSRITDIEAREHVAYLNQDM